MWAPLSPSHAHPPRRVVRLGHLLASSRSTLSLSRSGVAWSTPCQTRWNPLVNRVAWVHVPAEFLWSQLSFLVSSRRVWSNDFLEMYVSTQNAFSASESILNAFLLRSSLLPCFNLWIWQVLKKWRTRYQNEPKWWASFSGHPVWIDSIKSKEWLKWFNQINQSTQYICWPFWKTCFLPFFGKRSI